MSWGEILILALPFGVCLIFAIDQIFFDKHPTDIDDGDGK